MCGELKTSFINVSFKLNGKGGYYDLNLNKREMQFQLYDSCVIGNIYNDVSTPYSVRIRK